MHGNFNVKLVRRETNDKKKEERPRPSSFVSSSRRHAVTPSRMNGENQS
jgi:hypothetical protein